MLATKKRRFVDASLLRRFDLLDDFGALRSSPDIDPVVASTGYITPSLVFGSANKVLAWQRLIVQLSEWLNNPRNLDDDGVTPPSKKVLELSLFVAEWARDLGEPPPDRVTCDPNGGIVFERIEEGLTEEIHIWDDCSVEYMCFDGSRLLTRIPMM